MTEQQNRDFLAREERIRQLWQERRVFEQTTARRGPVFAFYDGPPTANGQPHVGHLLTRVIKDLVPRYKTMQGYQVPRKAGWDTHGLPVELEVERTLGLSGKEQIESYGLAPFIEKCKESVLRYQGLWEEFSDQIAYWADMEKPYVTCDDDYIESEWWALKEIHQKGLLYQGFQVVPYCPRCGTPLSSHEVAQGYQEVTERSALVEFRASEEEAYFLAWTTTPWTLPSNVALCVNPEQCYVRARKGERVYYLAESLAPGLLGPDYEVLQVLLGKELEGRGYMPLYPAAESPQRGHYITCDDYVTLEEGTGIVHLAPAFGQEDAQVGRRYDLPFVQRVDQQGCMTADTPWPGLFCKDADAKVLEDLKQRGLLFAAPLYTHSYPHCWRCDTPLLYYARQSWFIGMSQVKERLLHHNSKVNWVPASIGQGRFGDWLCNVQDWNIGRDRYWGTPLNLWQCPQGHTHAVGSRQELRQLAPDCPADLQLHRPFVDAITFPCPQCGETMHRVPQVVDCWFDSGAMPFAQHHYPFENKETFESQFPAAYVCEAVDQTRGWFYSLLAVSTLLFDRAPYENVLVLGHVQDEQGRKMSKSKGNAINPFDALAEFGADALRFYFASSTPWLPSRFSPKSVAEGRSKFLDTLGNTLAFYQLYADLGQFQPGPLPPKSSLGALDRWLLSKLQGLVEQLTGHLDAYRIPEGARALQAFVEELSNWYVRLSRNRFWQQGLGPQKAAACQTLYTTLVTLSKLCAPYVPYLAEEIYQALVVPVGGDCPESVHLCQWPKPLADWREESLEEEMARAQGLVELGRAARAQAGQKNRQPLGRLLVAGPPLCPQLQELVAQELNVKQVEFTQDFSRAQTVRCKAQKRTLGSKLGPRLPALEQALAGAHGNGLAQALSQQGVARVDLPDGPVLLQPEDVQLLVEPAPGWALAAQDGLGVALDANLTPALVEEGLLRELTSKIQTMRKEMGLAVTDWIHVTLQGEEALERLWLQQGASLAPTLLARSLVVAPPRGNCKDWQINGYGARIGIQRADP